MINFKAFRAVDNGELSEKFATGHENVLTSYGIKKVTSADREWIYNPFVYVVLITDALTGEPLGGGRIHVTNKNHPLPIEKAIKDIDPTIKNFIDSYSDKKTGELCGGWNIRRLGGSGLSILLIRACLAKSSLAIAKQLNLSCLFALCAPWTVKMFENIGYKIEYSMGQKGTYPYPSPDLLATVMIMEDTIDLKEALNSEKEKIVSLRENPQQTRLEEGIKKSFLVNYNLKVK